MAEDRKKIVIEKEDAVFWMDEHGNWCNAHGKFEHPKIIAYFNASIQKDEKGYYVHQIRDGFDESVYFPYTDTAIFVVGIKAGDPVILKLNIGKELELDPDSLFLKDDSLYLDTPEHRIKFSDRALVEFSKFLEEEDGTLFYRAGKTLYPLGGEPL